MSVALWIMLGIDIVSLLIMGAVILEFQHTRRKYAQLIAVLESTSSIGKEKLSLLIVWFYIGGFVLLHFLGFLMFLW